MMQSRVQALLLVGTMTVSFSLVACGGGGSGGRKQEKTERAPQAEVQTAQRPSTGTSAFQPDVEKGKRLYLQACSSCHGPDAKGIPNLGKDLTASEFVKSKTNQELLEFVKVGRPVGDPLNTTGIAMPPKGGNPALSDEDILSIIAYLRTLQQ